MTSTPSLSSLGHPALDGLDDQARQALDAQGQLLQFQPGQVLCETTVIPSQILLILQGEARLLHRHQGKLSTIAKLAPGNWVGLASLLRAAPCEEVSASSDLLALSLPDSLMLSWLEQQPSFRQWCATTALPAEVAALMELLLLRSPCSDINLQRALAVASQHAQAVPPESDTIQNEAAAGRLLFAASANAEGLDLGDPLEPSEPLPKLRGPLPLRLLSLPEGLVNDLLKPAPAGEAPAPQPGSALVAVPAPALPERSGLDLGNRSSSQASTLKLVHGEGSLEGTVACFQMMARLLKLPFRRDAVDRTLRDSLRRGHGANLQLCGQLAANMGLHVVGMTIPVGQASRMQTPAMVGWGDTFALVLESSSAGLRLATPDQGLVQLNPDQVASTYGEQLNLLVLDRSNTTPEQRFNFEWFLPALRRHRGALIQVLVASFVVQLFGLANPLLIQVIIDKVISQRSLDTLQVLGIALVVVALLEAVLGSLRTFLFAETTNRIDLRLGSEVIDHLLRLPLGYFDRRPVGELGTRIAELEKIRNFLTGQALTTMLDAAFSVIYVVVMALYSWVLTLVALAVLPIQVAITILGAPLFRRQYRKAAEENAKTQSHLVEVLTGIQTVKAQNVEMVSRWTWQDLYTNYIGRTFEKTITGTALNETSQFLQKLSQLLVLWIGAGMVLQGSLTLGQLIAFRIISGYVTQPLLRLSSIWQSVQELRVSFERLADVVDTPQESNETDQAKIPLPPIAGHVRFDDLSFSFAGTKPVLSHINLDVPAGTFVGIVGQSGSGKSTMMKLLPRLYAPQQGRILIDDYDIDKVELYSLRRQIGIVPQDPLLFSGTVNENIALTDPEASSEAIVKAAKIAGAHDFIMELPAGYSTPVGERGASLSGGQRQRIAIARTLLSNPKLLVLDEATSALDYATERRVCDNLVSALQGCTVFFITHRLNTIRRADQIIMMDQGAIVETGSHDALMAIRGRYYALYRQQESES